jgi:hypothetical protein
MGRANGGRRMASAGRTTGACSECRLHDRPKSSTHPPRRQHRESGSLARSPRMYRSRHVARAKPRVTVRPEPKLRNPN